MTSRLLAGAVALVRRAEARVPAGRHAIIVAAIAMAVVASLRPWLAIPLGPNLRGTQLRLSAPGVPLAAHANHGVTVLLGAALAAVGAWRYRRGPTVLLTLGGVIIAASAVWFLLATGWWDQSTSAAVTDGWQARRSVVTSLGYGSVDGTLPTAILGVTLGDPWPILIARLAHGWYLAILAGLMLSFAGSDAFSAAARQVPLRRAVIGTALVAAVVVIVLARGWGAQQLATDARMAADGGDTAAAANDLTWARRLDPEVTADPDYATAEGTVALTAGDRNSPRALLIDSRLRGFSGDRSVAFADLETAHQAAPNDIVITRELATRALAAAAGGTIPTANGPAPPGSGAAPVTSGSTPATAGSASATAGSAPATSGPAPLLLAPTGSGSSPIAGAAPTYLLGRYLYGAADYDHAKSYFRRVLLLTDDGVVTSSAHTYLALCAMRTGDIRTARGELLTAIALDPTYVNAQARALAVGIYTTPRT